MVSNAHAGTENDDPQVGALLDRQHQRLRDALHSALRSAQRQQQPAEGVVPGSAADILALLAHGVNLRSRAGADAQQLQATVAAAVTAVTRGR
ncbi:hypothetical protein [Streptomyces sp. NBC_00996]|uniref:hypothetical protein n=1 Tax=Streptomyces sp. NBC_00996 TaxID=2903710 RepID=UPI003863D0A2|nr:hypothetical protein OG390_00320 [Streptomyces sp. NBC_00996]